jgi:hypothetical protein
MLGMAPAARTIIVPPKLGYDDPKYATPKMYLLKSPGLRRQLFDVVPQQNTNRPQQ